MFGLGGICNQLAQINLECICDAKERIERGQAYASLDVADHLLGETGLLGNPVHGKSLAQTLFLERLDDSLANDFALGTPGHGMTLEKILLDAYLTIVRRRRPPKSHVPRPQIK